MTDEHHRHLLDHLGRGQLALFVGADLPREVTGLPSRADLARGLARRHDLDEALSLAEIAQRVGQAGNRHAFTSFIRDEVDTAGKAPQPFHKRVVKLTGAHAMAIITTAYDDLLEQAFREAGVGFNRVVRGGDVAFIDPQRPTLVKLYGDAGQVDTLVVTDRDHGDLLRDREKEALVDEVRQAFRRQTVLFLGYNLADPDFRFLFDQVAESRFARLAYAVWPGLPERDVTMWRDRGIVILDADPLGLLGQLSAPSAPPARPEPATGGAVKGNVVMADVSQGAEDGESLRRQLAEAETNLALIQERKAQFVLEVDVPLQLVKEERRLLARIAELETKLGELDAPRALHVRPQPVAATPASPAIGGDMDYERGLAAFKQLAEGTDWYQDLAVYEAPLRENLRDERRYGPAEQSRRDRARLVDQLNALALEHVGISFNDLCLGVSPPSRPQPASAHSKGEGTPATPETLYGSGNRWAVLVGVNEYEDKANYGQLQVCVKDVEAIRAQLIAGGFDPGRIRLLADRTAELPTRANILTALKAVADATELDDLLLFYYSGHGDEVGGESYLVARDGRRLVLDDTALAVARVKAILEVAPARAKVIVLDACHSGADIGGKGPKPMSAEFIRRVFEQAEGLAILAACKQGQLSYEWRDNERSVFTHFLLEALEGQADLDAKGFVTVQDANRHVTNGVKLWASRRNLSQTPTLQYTVAGDIILTRLGAQPSYDTSASSSREVVSVRLPEGAWSKFEEIAKGRGRTPEGHLEILIEMEYENNQRMRDLSAMPVLADWPTQQIALNSRVLGQLRSLSGAAAEHRISKIIREATGIGTSI